ncbi:SAM-dependent methyltransferase [Frigoribacterium sp. 2-23]|uniref:SAM-dependent methyltransferase n=1 Tax=Frigoribacterium sp. 2-23 TaxID=3415006 RepID=UPI003C6FDBA0
MSLVESEHTFGSGGAEPYARALRREGRLHLVRDGDDDARQGGSVVSIDTHAGSGRTTHAPDAFDVARWSADADAADVTALTFDGLLDRPLPVLDIGCGPARMVRAALDLGAHALGIDVSSTAVDMAAAAGLPVVLASVFEDVPRAGTWGIALLLDGNIGIGGDPAALLTRSAAVISPVGSVVVETAVDSTSDERYDARVVDEQGRASGSFPWAEIGQDALVGYAAEAGLEIAQTWVADGRTFCRLTHTV